MKYASCPKCRKRGLYWSNKAQVQKDKQKGLGSYKVFTCRYCGHKERLWAKQYQG